MLVGVRYYESLRKCASTRALQGRAVDCAAFFNAVGVVTLRTIYSFAVSDFATVTTSPATAFFSSGIKSTSKDCVLPS